MQRRRGTIQDLGRENRVGAAVADLDDIRRLQRRSDQATLDLVLNGIDRVDPQAVQSVFGGRWAWREPYRTPVEGAADRSSSDLYTRKVEELHPGALLVIDELKGTVGCGRIHSGIEKEVGSHEVGVFGAQAHPQVGHDVACDLSRREHLNLRLDGVDVDVQAR